MFSEWRWSAGAPPTIRWGSRAEHTVGPELRRNRKASFRRSSGRVTDQTETIRERTSCCNLGASEIISGGEAGKLITAVHLPHRNLKKPLIGQPQHVLLFPNRRFPLVIAGVAVELENILAM